jgi:hypothetical protein
MKNYYKNLDDAREMAVKKSITEAAWMSFMYCVITSFYAYVFYFGGYLRWNEIKNGDELYSAGSIITIMFATVFGVF